ncbi:MAG TPA: sulfurtransferase TusA family protein [Nitrospirota bacterium]|jgi:TusA-related sulfurtransferase
METIDLRGICCPTNFVRAKLALEEIEADTEVEILLDDGEPVKNLPKSLISEGHKLLGLTEDEAGFYRLRILTVALEE